MTSVTDWLNRSTTYGYNALGRIVSTLYENSSKTDIGYDAAGRLTSYTDKKSDGSVIASYAYTLDPNGNRLSATVTEPMAPKFSSSEYNFQYNTLNQLTSGLNSGFTFDANGNLIQEVVDGKTITYGYDDNDRLISWSDGAQSYQYTYSGTKDLMEVEKSGEKTRYVLDVNQNLPAVVARTDGSGEILDYFVYGAAGLVSKITPAGQAFTYHFDSTGSTIAMSDSSENLVNTYAYMPYGRTTRQESIDNPFEYVGRFGVMAEDNGLNYMRARFYHPGIRRFISQDTVWGEVSSPQSLNLYAYVEGNPVMRVDPSGFFPFDFVYRLPYILRSQGLPEAKINDIQQEIINEAEIFAENTIGLPAILYEIITGKTYISNKKIFRKEAVTNLFYLLMDTYLPGSSSFLKYLSKNSQDSATLNVLFSKKMVKSNNSSNMLNNIAEVIDIHGTLTSNQHTGPVKGVWDLSTQGYYCPIPGGGCLSTDEAYYEQLIIKLNLELIEL